MAPKHTVAAGIAHGQRRRKPVALRAAAGLSSFDSGPDFAPDLATKPGALSYTLHFLNAGERVHSGNTPVTQFPPHWVPATA
ncbi:hypothetical protein Veis_0190 [Verminephrobacter eiseniae EF01-2]|uniref:Uncharacterized protein n=1 Tax=Verminephrobacter eiseniae (strain EF01-2) TaxID=391735 RepID=A1WEC5_VEREI|nr:hypothetical protein Veis_0190 [Verminephrobacter eiseniae EF01-2]